MARTSKRIPADERRDRIIEMTLRLVADEGIEGATTARIAGASGVSEGTLYRLFGSKKGILLAALDRVHDHFMEMLESCHKPDPVECLEELGRLHTGSMVSYGIDRYIGPLFAFISAPAHMGLREAVAERQKQILDKYTRMIEAAKAAGTVPVSADSQQVAWMLAAIFWAEDISSLLALPGFVLEGRSTRALEAVIRCFARCPGCPNPGAGRLGLEGRPGPPAH